MAMEGLAGEVTDLQIPAGRASANSSRPGHRCWWSSWNIPSAPGSVIRSDVAHSIAPTVRN